MISDTYRDIPSPSGRNARGEIKSGIRGHFLPQTTFLPEAPDHWFFVGDDDIERMISMHER
jgi:hypothetical protein